jgi:AraC-like DNA-binding protein
MSGAPAFRLSTAHVPERDRIAVWCEVYGRQVLRLEPDISPEIAFHSNLAGQLLPGLGIIYGSIAPCRLRRTRQLLDDGTDNLFLIVPSGPALADQGGRETELAAGEGVLISSGEPGGVTFSDSTILALSLPRAALRAQLHDPDALRLPRVPRNTEALRLLMRYVAAAADVSMTESGPLRGAFVDHVHDLVALALGATRDAAALAGSRGLAAARLRAIKDDVRASLHEGGLDVATVARRHGVSPRYVQMLFETEGTTFTQFLREARLARVHQMLRSPRGAGVRISAIAYEAGFGDLSTFNNAFRRRYGGTPSDVRAGATRAERT